MMAPLLGGFYNHFDHSTTPIELFYWQHWTEEDKTLLEAYRKHVAERAEQGIVPKPLSAEQVAGIVELLKWWEPKRLKYISSLMSYFCWSSLIIQESY